MVNKNTVEGNVFEYYSATDILVFSIIQKVDHMNTVFDT